MWHGRWRNPTAPLILSSFSGRQPIEMNISQQFLSEIDMVARRDIPEEVMSRARRSLLDYLAVTCAGAEFQKEKMKGYFGFSRSRISIETHMQI